MKVEIISNPFFTSSILNVPLEPKITDREDKTICDPWIKAEAKTLIWFEQLDSDTRAVIKMYRNPGRCVSAWCKWHKCRAQREFELLNHLVANGIPCSKPILWSKGYSDIFGFYQILATQVIQDAKPLKEYLNTAGCRVNPVDFSSLFKNIRAMHKRGIRHGGMSFKNIMVKKINSGVFVFYILDLSRATFFPYDISGTKMAWYDLKDIVTKIANHFGISGCNTLLSQYGLTPGSAQELLKQIEGYRPTKHTRNFIRLECDFKAFCAAMGFPYQGKTHQLIESNKWSVLVSKWTDEACN